MRPGLSGLPQHPARSIPHPPTPAVTCPSTPQRCVPAQLRLGSDSRALRLPPLCPTRCHRRFRLRQRRQTTAVHRHDDCRVRCRAQCPSRRRLADCGHPQLRSTPGTGRCRWYSQTERGHADHHGPVATGIFKCCAQGRPRRHPRAFHRRQP